MVCTVEEANQHIVQFYEQRRPEAKNAEKVLDLTYVEGPFRSMAAFYRACINAIPDECLLQCKRGQSHPEHRLSGASVNHNLFTYFDRHFDGFVKTIPAGVCILSIIQPPYFRLRYYNCDWVGAIGYGSVTKADGGHAYAAIREACEESCMSDIKPEDLMDSKFDKTYQPYESGLCVPKGWVEVDDVRIYCYVSASCGPLQ